MQKIRDKAAWVVGVAVVCFGALIFVDWGMSPGNSLTHKNIVGNVAGEDIRVEEFEQLVQDKAKEQTDQGRELNSEAYAQIRRAVFNDILRERLLAKAFQQYNLFGTPEQNLDYIRRNPPPGAEKAPIFMGPDSQFSQPLYERWLANPKTFDDRYMRLIEGIAGNKTIPEQSMGRIFATSNLKTSLETSFETRMERNRGWGIAIAASVDSFQAPVPSESALRKEFEVLSDSFWIGAPYARMTAAVCAKVPSAADSLRAQQDADTAAARAKRGEKFEDLVQQYSEDPGSAKNGGSLGGLRSRAGWVPAFSEAVAKMDKGQISEPVKSQFGYHIIKVKDRVINDLPAPAKGKDTLYDVQHILIMVSISPETIDSLKRRLENARTLVKTGVPLSTAAAKVGVRVDSVHVSQGDIGILGTTPKRGAPDVVPGASAWAFHPQEQETSEILENAKSLVVLSKPKISKVGRDFELAKPNLIRHIQRMEAAKLAQAYLQANLAKIKACDTSSACLTQIGKLSVTPLVERPASSWILGLGYSPLPLFTLWSKAVKAPHTLVGPAVDDRGALVVRLDSAAAPTAAELAVWAPPARNHEGYVAKAALDDWLAARRREAHVKNNLDQFFRD